MNHNITTYHYWIVFVLCFGYHSMSGQSWELEKEIDGIQIFTRSVSDSDLKELKIEFSLDIGLSPIVSILHDDQNLTEWVYNCKAYETLDKESPGNGHFYGVTDFPWPLDDRDYFLETTSEQCPITKVVTIQSKDVQNTFGKSKTKYTRMASHLNRWTLTPISKEKTALEYYLKSDPGGAIPSSFINLAIDKGAIQTIFNMKKRLERCCQDVQLAYIQEK